jgi:hypothetical protein
MANSPAPAASASAGAARGAVQIALELSNSANSGARDIVIQHSAK